jgi:hypothetical protein
MELDGKHLGKFEITSGIMRVTDPCYDKETWCSGTLDARNGTWEAYVEVSDEGQWGKRAATLIVFHEETQHSGGGWEKSKINVGVDSGQAGFFDNALYPDTERTGEYGDVNTFYGKVCTLTHDEKDRSVVGGVLPFGAVSSSGFGDGGYDCYVRRDEMGQVVAAKIVFITDEEEIDDEEF